MLRTRLTAALVAAPLLAGAALADPPDRSTLSYEDNVTINTACFAAHAKGEFAYRACVGTQLAAVASHPAPDRTKLSARRNRAIELDCAYLRRTSLADYNDCLGKGVAATVPAALADEDAIVSNVANVALVKALTAVPDPVAAGEADPAVKRPGAVLPPRPDRRGRQALDPAEIFRKVERSVFVVGAARSVGDARARDVMQGSAIAVAPHLLLTNCHVVLHRPVIVLLQDHLTYRAHLVAADEAADRCVLASDGAALEPVAAVRPFDDLAVGERVFAIGAPMSLERTMSDGLASGLRPSATRNMIQTSAAISRGSSGGGLFDERGNLLGITTLGSLPGWQNLNFAIAASDFWR